MNKKISVIVGIIAIGLFILPFAIGQNEPQYPKAKVALILQAFTESPTNPENNDTAVILIKISAPTATYLSKSYLDRIYPYPDIDTSTAKKMNNNIINIGHDYAESLGYHVVKTSFQNFSSETWD